MKHFLGTRFNLKFSNWKTNKNGNKVLTKNWLNHRFEIFESYCFKSVREQDTSNFFWCLFFDESTPKQFKTKILELTKDYSNFHILFIEGMDALNKSFKSFILDNIDEEDKFVITSRLDNDDFVASDFISRIQSFARPIDNLIIDLQKGYQFVTDTDRTSLKAFTHEFNPFISIVENRNNIQTVYAREHYHWNTSRDIIKYLDKPMWIEVVHTENMINDSREYLKQLYHIDNNRFKIPLNIHYTFLEILLNESLVFIKNKIIMINHLIEYFLKTLKKIKKVYSKYLIDNDL